MQLALIDLPFLLWLETRVIRLQNAIGVPKWRIAQISWCLGWVCFIVANLGRGWGWVLWYTLAILDDTISPTGKSQQELADRTFCPVPNPRQYQLWYFFLRMLVWGSILAESLRLILRKPDANFLWLAGFFCGWIAIHLDSLNTWPISGPTIWSRIKSRLKTRIALQPETA